MLQRATYIGPVERMKGEKALVRLKKPGAPSLKAQFNNVELVVAGQRLGIGWHTFKTEHFTIQPGDPSTVDANGDTLETASCLT